MKKAWIVITLIACLALVTVLIVTFADTNNPNVICSTFNVSVHHNALFSQYGVTIYFDDVEVAYLNQGDALTFKAYMEADQTHVLRFDPDKEGVPDRIWTISNLQNGSALTCELQTKRDQVEIKSQDLIQNGQTVFSASPEIKAQVKALGTIIATGIQVYKELQ